MGFSREIAERTEFYHIWDRYVLKGDSSLVPVNIKSSWERCRRAELDHEKVRTSIVLDQKSLEERIKKQEELYHIARSHYKEVENLFYLLPFAVLFVDKDGYLLSIEGDKDISTLLGDEGIKQGGCSRESISGTSAPGICLEEKRFAMVKAEEHYIKSLHWACCIAIPLFDEKKDLLAVLDFTTHTGYADKLHQLIPVLFEIGNSIQFEFYLKKRLEEQLGLLNCYYHSTFGCAKNALVMIDWSGKVIDLNINAQNILRLKPHQIKGMNASQILGERFKIEDLIKGPTGMTLRLGDEARYMIESLPIFDHSGRVVACLLRLDKEGRQKAIRPETLHKARYTFDDIVTESPVMSKIIEKAKAAALTGSNILIEGKTGTGKELFAHAIHNESLYRNGPFVAINCAAIPRELVESELFGYVRGAYTGALREGSPGKFELANEGTVFMDEVHAMDLGTQHKVLRVIENREVIRIGGKTVIPLNIRLIAATSADLEEEMEKGCFIPALFYRLNVVKLSLPELKDRKEDIPALTMSFIQEMKKRFTCSIDGIEPEALRLLMDYPWPGNIRELKNCIESAFNFCTGRYITTKDLLSIISSEEKDNKKCNRDLNDIMKDVLEEALKVHGSAKKAAGSLGIPLSTFYRRLRRLGI